MHVLVTGGAGFIGSHSTEALLADGANVTVLDNFSAGKRSNLPETHANLRIVKGDIREALPLVLLEGYAAGVPGVSTDVGSCRQLIYGLDDEDKALGASGRVVGIADPQALADAAIELLSDPEKWHSASVAGMKRVEKYYSQDRMFGSYREVYEKALASSGGIADVQP